MQAAHRFLSFSMHSIIRTVLFRHKHSVLNGTLCPAYAQSAQKMKAHVHGMAGLWAQTQCNSCDSKPCTLLWEYSTCEDPKRSPYSSLWWEMQGKVTSAKETTTVTIETADKYILRYEKASGATTQNREQEVEYGCHFIIILSTWLREAIQSMWHIAQMLHTVTRE